MKKRLNETKQFENSNVIFGKVLFEGLGQFYYKLTLASTFQIK